MKQLSARWSHQNWGILLYFLSTVPAVPAIRVYVSVSGRTLRSRNFPGTYGGIWINRKTACSAVTRIIEPTFTRATCTSPAVLCPGDAERLSLTLHLVISQALPSFSGMFRHLDLLCLQTSARVLLSRVGTVKTGRKKMEIWSRFRKFSHVWVAI